MPGVYWQQLPTNPVPVIETKRDHFYNLCQGATTEYRATEKLNPNPDIKVQWNIIIVIE